MSSEPEGINSVFLNVPYDHDFEDLYIAYVVGLISLGLTPVATLAIAGGAARLDRILGQIQSCRYSVHDLSRVEISSTPPHFTPRFNMPFEFGMAVTWAKLNPTLHSYAGFESVERRAHKSLSDMAEHDFYIHGGKVPGVMRQLCNAFVRAEKHPSVPEMVSSFKIVRSLRRELLKTSGATDLFEARPFEDLVLLAKKITQR